LIFHLGRLPKGRAAALAIKIEMAFFVLVGLFFCAIRFHEKKFSSIRIKLVGAVLLFITPAFLVMYIYHLPMSQFTVGFLALAAAWMGGELFVRRQVKAMSETARKLPMAI